MRNKLGMKLRRVQAPIIAELPKLSGAELARSSWAILVTSYTDVPEVYKCFFDPPLAGGEVFPYTVLTPSHERFIHRQTEQLISVFGHNIYILQRRGEAFETHCYPLKDISYVEFRTALLASSFKICGMTSQGVHTSSTLIFNSVTDYLFKPILRSVRFDSMVSREAAQSSELEKFNQLIKVNYKFMAYAKHSLLGGERVLHFVLQPEIRERMLPVLGKTYSRLLTPTHLSILTDQELIVIQENTARRKEDRYGCVRDYFPLNKIRSLSVSERTDNLLVLAVQLPENILFEFLFQAPAKEEFNQLLDKYMDLIAV